MRRVTLFLAAIVIAGCARSTGAVPAVVAAPALQKPPALYSILHEFAGSYDDPADGVWPTTTPILASDGDLFGTTYGGGETTSGICNGGCGTIYTTTKSGSEKVLHRFAGQPEDGAVPEGDLVIANGRIYGTTFYGGANLDCAGRACGTIFEIDASGSGYKVLHSFKGGADGSNPEGPLRDWNGALYGSTTSGLDGHVCAGDNGVYGTLFTLNSTGTETPFWHFAGAPNDGACPLGRLAASGGTLYGVTYEGGTNNTGTLYSVSQGHKVTMLASFKPSIGDYPVGVVAFQNPTTKTITLYGALSADGPNGTGAIFSYDVASNSFNWFSTFPKDERRGGLPYAAPVITKDGSMLYGTTEGGGICGVGTVFSMTPAGTESVLYSFVGDRVVSKPDGSAPVSGLLIDGNTLYGTTVLGGVDRSVHGLGTLFAVATSDRGAPSCPKRTGSGDRRNRS